MTLLNISGPIAEFLASVHLAPRQSHKQLTLWPLVQNETHSPDAYVSLADALEAGWLEVDELDEHGSVPNVTVRNRGDQSVLVLFGEGIVGAKQNRIANASFLVPAKSEVVIDVSCMEAGRWGRRTRTGFESSGEVVSASLRKLMQEQVSESRRRGRRFTADQEEVWDSVQARLMLSNVHSASSDYTAYSSSRKTDLDEIGSAFQPVAGQVGFVAARGDAIEGVEIVGDPAVFASAFWRLLRAYSIDAVDAALLRRSKEGQTPAPAFDAPESFLEALAQAPVRRGPSLGEGEDLRFRGDRVAGCALHCEGLGIVHLTAYPERGAVDRNDMEEPSASGGTQSQTVA